MERSAGRSRRRRRRSRPVLGATLAVATAAALTVTGLVSTAQAADINNAKNAGFESGLANWSCSGGSGAAVSSPCAAVRPR